MLNPYNISILFLILLIASTFFIEVEVFYPKEEGRIEVYFSNQHDVLSILLAKLSSAKNISCAFYDIESDELFSLLKLKKSRLIVDDSLKLEGAKTDNSRKLMHNKFCVWDCRYVFTGSLNPTFRGLNLNDNNIVFIESEKIAGNYLDEFEEMWGGAFHGGRTTWNKKILLDGVLIENYFCPEDDCSQQVLRTLSKAEHSIYFMTFSFTDGDIANLLQIKHYGGVDVKGIFENSQAGNSFSQYSRLKQFSVLDANPYTMHHKVFIIDNSTVITGSYNPTANADRNNDENILIIHDEDIAQRYLREFSRITTFNNLR